MSAETNILEEYVLANDKLAYLETIKSNSLYSHLLLCYRLNNEEDLESQEIIDLANREWEFKARRMLTSLEKVTDPVKKSSLLYDLNYHFHNNHFNYDRPVKSQVVDVETNKDLKNQNPTEIPEDIKKTFLLENRLQSIYNGSRIFERLTERERLEVDIHRIKDIDEKIYAINSLPSFDHVQGLGRLFTNTKVEYEQKYSKQGYKYNVPGNVISKFSLGQLKEVAECMGIERNVDILIRIFKLEFFRELDDICNRFRTGENLDCISALESFRDTHILSRPEFSHIITVINRIILDLKIKNEIPDLDLFIYFLEHPTFKRTRELLKENQRTPEMMKKYQDFNSQWREPFQSFYYSNLEDNEIVYKGLELLAVNESNVATLEEFFNSSQLRNILVRYETIHGIGKIDTAIKELGQYEVDQLSKQKKLDILSTNAANFEKKKTDIRLRIKNIRSLEVRIYQLDTINYLRENNSLPENDIDLDGLVPEVSLSYTYDQSSHIEHIETFGFEDIDRKDRGYFIIDFIGGGLQSRAIVKKGTLSLIHEPHEYGYKYSIVDEKKKICFGKDTGMYIEGKWLPANSDGSVIIPFDKNHQSRTALLVHDDFAYMSHLSIPIENYTLQSSFLFNEEALISSRKIKFAIKNRLYLNENLISLSKLKDISVTYTTNTFEGVTNSKTIEDIELSDSLDFLLEILVPQNLNTLTISFKGAAQLVCGDKSIVQSSFALECLSTTSYLAFLNFEVRDGKWILKVTGKNAEPVPDIQVELRFRDIYGRSNPLTCFNYRSGGESLFLWSDKDGIIKLGELKGISTVAANFVNLSGAASVLNLQNKFTSDIPQLFSCCLGEELVIPRNGCELSRENISLHLTARGDFSGNLKDFFSNISIEESNFIIKDLEEGQYTLKYYLEDRVYSVSIEVSNSKRWECGFVLEDQDSLRYLKGESRYLNISDTKIENNQLYLKVVSNDVDNIVAHAYGFHFNPEHAEWLSEKSRSSLSQRKEIVFEIPKTANTYSSGRVLGDELRYAMERKNKKTFIGNTLQKPSILLTRKLIQETLDNDEVLNSGATYGAVHDLGPACRKMASNKRMMERRSSNGGGVINEYTTGWTFYNSKEYISKSGSSIENIKPSKDGDIVIDLGKFTGYSNVVVYISDSFGHVMKRVQINDSLPEYRDLRLSEAKEAGIIYTEERFAVPCKRGEEITLQDIQNTKFTIIDSLRSMFDSLMIIGSDIVTQIDKWNFLCTWNILSREEKIEKLNEYGGHELFVFCKFKDPNFFNHEIKPILIHKSEKQIIDLLLIEDRETIEGLIKSPCLQNLSPLSLSLLITICKESHPKRCRAILESIVQRTALLDKSTKTTDLYIDSIINSKKEDQASESEGYYEEDDCYGGGGGGGGGGGPMMDLYCAPTMARACIPQYEKEMECEGGDSSEPEEDEEDERESSPQQNMFMKSRMISTSNKPATIEKYNKAGAAFEYGERHQFFSQGPENGEFNKFWQEVIRTILEEGIPNVLNETILDCSREEHLFVYALAFVGLPFEAGNTNTKIEGQDLKLLSTENIIVLCRKIEEKSAEKVDLDLFISQKFYDPSDQYIIDEHDSRIKKIKEVNEFLVGGEYTSQITITNLSDNHLSMKLIYQIPAGSIRVHQFDALDIEVITIGSLRTQLRSFSFYFPSPGDFKTYPATLTRNNKFVASAKIPNDLKAVTNFSIENRTLHSLQDILQFGSEQDILTFLREKNLFNGDLFDVSQILWMCKKEETYKEIISILKAKEFYDERVWAHSILHKDFETYYEYIANNHSFKNTLGSLQYFKHPAILIDRFVPLEYDPLINPRAHSLAEKKENIRNKSFKETYSNFLNYCCEKNMESREWLILTSYLVLQDRVEEALKIISKVNPEEVNAKGMKLQYDYLRAYLSIYTEYPTFETARLVAKEYQNFSEKGWAKRFAEISNQLSEYDASKEVGCNTDSQKVHILTNAVQVNKAEFIKAEHKEGELHFNLTTMNVSRLTIKYYILNMEILFSIDPFFEKSTKSFGYINANHTEEIEINQEEHTKTIVEVPEHLKKHALFVFVKGTEKSQSLKIFNSRFEVDIIDDFGLLKVKNKEGQLLSSVYVKCYAKKKNGEVSFYKDGYTDFRGSFDYASLNSDSLSKVERFTVLVLHEELGSTIVSAKPPSDVARIIN